MKEKKKGNSGAAVSFMTRKAALKKLQISLQEFRKLCILKGIFPRDPKKKPKGGNKTYYYTKDILFLSHDPLLPKFREYRILKRKIRRAKGRKEYETVKRLKQNAPKYTIDHIIKERYPTFNDALQELDDALSMIFLFINMPQNVKIRKNRIVNCMKLCREFQLYAIKTHALRKIFVSIKGIYYQAEILDQTITWLTPHQYNQQIIKDVDYKVMTSFLELYENLMGFVLFRLYTQLGLRYPPDHSSLLISEDEGESALDSILLRLDNHVQDNTDTVVKQKTEQRISTLDHKQLLEMDAKAPKKTDEIVQESSSTVEEDQEFLNDQNKFTVTRTLFSGCKFFLAREVPRRSLEFVIRSFGGEVVTDPAQEKDEKITHQVVDRSWQQHQYFSRIYIQPQWVYDSANEKILLPASEYMPGATLPPHLSPFVNDGQEGYIPKRRETLSKVHEAISTGQPFLLDPVPGGDEEVSEGEEGDEDNEDEEGQNSSENEKEETLESQFSAELKAEVQGEVYSKKRKAKVQEETKNKEEESLPKIMMSKKTKWLHNRIMYGKKKRKEENEHLETKRRKVDEQHKKTKEKK